MAHPAPYPPGPGYQHQQPPPTYQQPAIITTGITTNVFVQPKIFGPNPQTAFCSQCRKQVVTSVRYEAGTLTWILCVVMLFIGFWPCSLIPFCCDDVMDTHHYCPNCDALLGKHKRM